MTKIIIFFIKEKNNLLFLTTNSFIFIVEDMPIKRGILEYYSVAWEIKRKKQNDKI